MVSNDIKLMKFLLAALTVMCNPLKMFYNVGHTLAHIVADENIILAGKEFHPCNNIYLFSEYQQV